MSVALPAALAAAPPVALPAAPLSALSTTDAQRAIAEVQAALIIARANPRDIVRVIDLVKQDCTRPGLAERAVYSYARGGSDVSGPSIRLAEAIAQRYGNMQYGIRELEQRAGESVVQAFAWDVETNTRREVTFAVKHVRDTKRGRVTLEDARDIYEMTANQGARRLRACILGVIPGDIVEEALGQVEATLHAKADVTPERLKKMVEAFAAYRVSQAQIEARIQRRIDAITPALFVQLQKIYNSLRDGMSAPEDWFEPVAAAEPADAAKPATGVSAVKAKLAGAAKPAAAGADAADARVHDTREEQAGLR